MRLSEILTEEELHSIPENVSAKIESAYSKAIESYEADGEKKFNTLVEAVSTQFDSVVNEAVQKKVDKMNNNVMSGKLFDAMQKIVNVLNECQIETNQVKEARHEAEAVKEELQKSVIKYKLAMKKLMYANIAQIVFRETSGYKPEIQQKAVEYFTNPKLNINADDLKREDILNYINGIDDGKISSTEFSGIGEIKTPDQLDMNELNDVANTLAIDDIEMNGFTNYDKNKLAVNEVKYPSANIITGTKKKLSPKVASVGFGDKQATFESLGKGLSENKVFGSNPDVTYDMLNEAANGIDTADADVMDAMNIIHDFSSFT